MEKVIPKTIAVYKKIGETPLEALLRIRKDRGIPEGVPMTYAGRLDPAAEGLLLILTGDECKRKDRYLCLDKEYILEVVLGVETDTQDVLGLITKVNIREGIMGKKYDEYIGTYTQEYPIYSSRMIASKGIMDRIPSKKISIYSIEKLDERKISGQELALHALKVVADVKGDFRQQDISRKWRSFSQEFGTFGFKIVKLKVSCSSGTYMRILAQRIGKDTGMGGIAYSIKRTRIGEVSLSAFPQTTYQEALHPSSQAGQRR